MLYLQLGRRPSEMGPERVRRPQANPHGLRGDLETRHSSLQQRRSHPPAPLWQRTLCRRTRRHRLVGAPRAPRGLLQAGTVILQFLSVHFTFIFCCFSHSTKNTWFYNGIEHSFPSEIALLASGWADVQAQVWVVDIAWRPDRLGQIQKHDDGRVPQFLHQEQGLQHSEFRRLMILLESA